MSFTGWQALTIFVSGLSIGITAASVLFWRANRKLEKRIERERNFPAILEAHMQEHMRHWS